MHPIEHAARTAHETIRVLQIHDHDPDPAPPWDQAPDWMRLSTLAGVHRVLSGMDAPALHAAWMRDRIDQGWVHGPIKNTTDRTHPNLVPWDDLPDHERLKDILFVAVVSNVMDTHHNASARFDDADLDRLTNPDRDPHTVKTHRARLIPFRYQGATTDQDGVLKWMRGVSNDRTRHAIITGPIWSGKTHAMYAAVGALIAHGHTPRAIAIHDAHDLAQGHPLGEEPVVIVDNITYRVDNHIPHRPRPIDPHDPDVSDVALERHRQRSQLVATLTALADSHATSWMVIGSSRTAFEQCIGSALTDRLYRTADHVIDMPARPLPSIPDMNQENP